MGMRVLYERCCGLDIHKKTVVTCLLLTPTSDNASREVGTFATMMAVGEPGGLTGDLERHPHGHGIHRAVVASDLQRARRPKACTMAYTGHP